MKRCRVRYRPPSPERFAPFAEAIRDAAARDDRTPTVNPGPPMAANPGRGRPDAR